MKNLKLFFGLPLLAFIFTVGIYSCWQDDFMNPSLVKKESSGIGVIQADGIIVDFDETATDAIIAQIPFSSISVNNGILAFTDRESMDSTLNLLTDAKNVWNTEMNTHFETMSDDDTNDVIVDDFYSFTQFETQLGFHSLRKNIEDEIDAWLAAAGEELDFDIYPGNHSVKDYQIRAIYNPESEVIIGNSIFKEYESGIGIEIPGLNFSILTQLREVTGIENLIAFAGANNLPLLGDWANTPSTLEKNFEECNWWEERNCRWGKKVSHKGKERDARIRGEVGVYNSVITGTHKIWAENDTFIKRTWWRRYKTRNFVRLTGHFYSRDNSDDDTEQCEIKHSTPFLPAMNGCPSCSRVEAELKGFETTVFVGDRDKSPLKGEHEALGFSSLRKTCIPKFTCLKHNCK